MEVEELGDHTSMTCETIIMIACTISLTFSTMLDIICSPAKLHCITCRKLPLDCMRTPYSNVDKRSSTIIVNFS